MDWESGVRRVCELLARVLGALLWTQLTGHPVWEEGRPRGPAIPSHAWVQGRRGETHLETGPSPPLDQSPELPARPTPRLPLDPPLRLACSSEFLSPETDLAAGDTAMGSWGEGACPRLGQLPSQRGPALNCTPLSKPEWAQEVTGAQ